MRLASYGWEDSRMGVPPGSTTVEIELSEQDGVTTLRLTHRDLPPPAVEDHERGWAYFLGRLANSSRSNRCQHFRHHPTVEDEER